MTWDEAFQHCYDNGGRLPFESSGDFPTARKVLRYDLAAHPAFKFNLAIRADGYKSESFLVFKYFEKKVRLFLAEDSFVSTKGGEGSYFESGEYEFTVTADKVKMTNLHDSTKVISSGINDLQEIEFYPQTKGVLFDRNQLEFYTVVPSSSDFEKATSVKSIDQKIRNDKEFKFEPDNTMYAIFSRLSRKAQNYEMSGKHIDFPYYGFHVSYQFTKLRNLETLDTLFGNVALSTTILKSNDLETCISVASEHDGPELLAWVYWNKVEQYKRGICLVTSCVEKSSEDIKFTEKVGIAYSNYKQYFRVESDINLRIAVLKKQKKHGRPYDASKLGVEIDSNHHSFRIVSDRPIPVDSMTFKVDKDIESVKLGSEELWDSSAFQYIGLHGESHIYVPINQTEYRNELEVKTAGPGSVTVNAQWCTYYQTVVNLTEIFKIVSALHSY